MWLHNQTSYLHQYLFLDFFNGVCWHNTNNRAFFYRKLIKLTLICYDATSFHPALGCLCFLRFGGEQFTPQRIQIPFFLEIFTELGYGLFTCFFIVRNHVHFLSQPFSSQYPQDFSFHRVIDWTLHCYAVFKVLQPITP